MFRSSDFPLKSQERSKVHALELCGLALMASLRFTGPLKKNREF